MENPARDRRESAASWGRPSLTPPHHPPPPHPSDSRLIKLSHTIRTHIDHWERGPPRQERSGAAGASRTRTTPLSDGWRDASAG